MSDEEEEAALGAGVGRESVDSPSHSSKKSHSKLEPQAHRSKKSRSNAARSVSSKKGRKVRNPAASMSNNGSDSEANYDDDDVSYDDEDLDEGDADEHAGDYGDSDEDSDEEEKEEAVYSLIDDAAPPRERLTKFYEAYNPSKIDEVDDTLKKYRGRLDRLWKLLTKKYLDNDGKVKKAYTCHKCYAVSQIDHDSNKFVCPQCNCSVVLLVKAAELSVVKNKLSAKALLKCAACYQDGKLVIFVKSARNLHSKQGFTPSAFVQATLLRRGQPVARSVQRTETVPNRANPKWNAFLKYQLDIEDAREHGIQITIWDAMRGHIAPPEFIGFVAFSLESLKEAVILKPVRYAITHNKPLVLVEPQGQSTIQKMVQGLTLNKVDHLNMVTVDLKSKMPKDDDSDDDT